MYEMLVTLDFMYVFVKHYLASCVTSPFSHYVWHYKWRMYITHTYNLRLLSEKMNNQCQHNIFKNSDFKKEEYSDCQHAKK